MFEIVKAPNSVLSQEAKKIVKFDKNLKKLVNDMAKTLEAARDPEGIGLAAPQVGKSLQLFIIKESRKAPLRVFINPVIDFPKNTPLQIEKRPKGASKPAKDFKMEGCLSLGDIWGQVKRYPKLKITFQDETGAAHTEEHKGFFATIIQHEYDHLQGILFPKLVLEQKGKLYRSKKDAKGELVFEELPL